jgi:hypothetical protein
MEVIKNSYSHTPQEAALDKTKWILKNYKPKLLDENAADEIKRIINTGEDELLK